VNKCVTKQHGAVSGLAHTYLLLREMYVFGE